MHAAGSAASQPKVSIITDKLKLLAVYTGHMCSDMASQLPGETKVGKIAKLKRIWNFRN